MVGCDCTATLEFMARRGAPHASRMLALKIHESKWTPLDLRTHFAEERTFFFPFIPAHIVRVLATQHAVFLGELKRFGRIVSTGLFVQHAKIENTYAKQLMRAA